MTSGDLAQYTEETFESFLLVRRNNSRIGFAVTV